jgi:hypothetical protein
MDDGEMWSRMDGQWKWLSWKVHPGNLGLSRNWYRDKLLVSYKGDLTTISIIPRHYRSWIPSGLHRVLQLYGPDDRRMAIRVPCLWECCTCPAQEDNLLGD